MHLEEVFRCGLAGTCVFSYTDEWFTGGHPITDWAFGLVRRDRSPKPAFHRVAEVYRAESPLPALPRYPEGLGGRLQLQRLPRRSTAACARCRSSTTRTTRSSSSTTAPPTRCPRSPRATRTSATTRSRTSGLSVARNVGMDLAARRDHRLHRRRLLRRRGLALLPRGQAARDGRLGRGRPEPAARRRRPRGRLRLREPRHARPHPHRRQRGRARARLQHGLLGRPPARDRRLRPRLPKAGDDVDVCWRLQAEGDYIVYAPAAMVWHHRRATVHGLPQAAARLRRRRGPPEAQAPREVPRLPRRPLLDGPHLHARRPRPRASASRSSTTASSAPACSRPSTAAPQVWWPLLVLSLEWWLLVCLMLGLAPVCNPRAALVAAGASSEPGPISPFANPLPPAAAADARHDRRPSPTSWRARPARRCTSGAGGRGCSSRPCTSRSPWSAAGRATRRAS